MKKRKNTDQPASAFEWDEEKRQKNIEKHGIDFSTAVLAFSDKKASNTALLLESLSSDAS